MNTQRIQLRRTKGWRKPEGTVVVSRPSRWGNPFCVGRQHGGMWLVWDARSGRVLAGGFATKRDAAEDAVGRYRAHFDSHPSEVFHVRRLLAGRDLACWCALDQPCHADVLLELANRPAS